MIIYFADRHMKILGQASTSLPSGFVIRKDEKIEDTDTGVASFSCYITFEDSVRLEAEAMAEAGNYLLRKNEDENEFYTIIDSEVDVEAHEIYVYAEDAGLDLLNEIADPYEATSTHPIAWYVEKWTEDSGFEVGINEIPNLTRKLKWDGESTITERLASVATQFDNAEISYSFDIDGLIITNKYVNIHKKRGKDIGDELRINKHLSNIVIKKSVANLATALRVTGGTPEGKEDPITLKGYDYDDGDFYVDSNGILKSRKAVERWTRYCWEKKIPGYEGHIEKTYSYDTTNKQTLCAHAVTELKSICEMEVNYEAEIAVLPDTVKIGDRVNIIDDNGELYVSARLLELKTSIVEGTRKATFGEYLIKDSGISDKVEALAAQFAEIAKTRVFYTWIAYADDEEGTGITLDPTGKAYMGISANRMNETPDITDPTVYKWSKIQGSKGDIGLSLVSVTEYYLLSNLTEGVTTSTQGWSTDIPTMSADNKYLWNYEVFNYSDGSTETMEPKIIGAYGDTGAAGDPAPEIVTMSEQYYMSTSATELAGGEWTRTMPQWTSGKYLWTRWCIEWSEPNPETLTYSEPVVATAFNEIHETADDAKVAAEEAKTEAESATGQVSQINTELAQAQQELDALTESLETLESTMSTSYATKGELTAVETDLSSQIQQNATQISQTVTQVQQIDIDASQALQDAADAAAAAATAQEAATEAQNKYNTLKQQADATDEQLAAAEQAVQTAQAAADAAQAAADAAQADADSLADRVTAAETQITQNAEEIALGATKTEMEAADEETLAGAKSYADAQIQISADSITSTVSDTYATKEENEITAAAVDALDDTVNGKYEVVLDDEGNPVQAKDDSGNPVYDEDGNPVYEQIYTEGVKDSVENMEQLTAEIDDAVTRLDTDFGALEQQFSTIEQTVENVNINFGELGNDMKAWFDFSAAGVLEIGQSDSPVVSRQTNESYAFVEKSTSKELLRLDTEGATVDTLNADQVRVGRENPQWAIRLGANGNLDDVWIGG